MGFDTTKVIIAIPAIIGSRLRVVNDARAAYIASKAIAVLHAVSHGSILDKSFNVRTEMPHVLQSPMLRIEFGARSIAVQLLLKFAPLLCFE